ncbi:hypothetical protein [Dictyobacter aurantiacus]|uniref:hypothetical protein n=1 Tax=Dictyobacter aurantiacus TaxID=1936993 RepID=UPI000F81AD8D|nr:hypothetical protein [Dictyobacter aurantiacus]
MRTLETIIPFADFEKTPKGHTPFRLTSSHPMGNYLAMQAGIDNEGLVWETGTKRIFWQPEGAIALAWLEDGTRIAVFRKSAGSSYYSTTYEFALYSWPERQLLHSCPVSSALVGWGEDLLVFPHNQLALCTICNEDATNFEFIDLNSHYISQDIHASYLLEGADDVLRPVMGPDGQLWVCCTQKMRNGGHQTQKQMMHLNNQLLEGNTNWGRCEYFRGNDHSLVPFQLLQRSPLAGCQKHKQMTPSFLMRPFSWIHIMYRSTCPREKPGFTDFIYRRYK